MENYSQPMKKIKLDALQLNVKNDQPQVVFNSDKARCLNVTGTTFQPAATLNVTNKPIFIYLQNNASNSKVDSNNKYYSATASKSASEQKEDSIKKLFVSMQNSILQRLESIEQKLEGLSSRCHILEETLDAILIKTTEDTKNKINPAFIRKDPGSFFVDSPQVSAGGDIIRISSQLQYLNSEESYPNGSWLGDPNVPDMRVRCAVNPSDLFALNDSCPTPEKMALTLLDYLFDRETQACSNISGTGKHGKNQLDPLKIFGIRCHLMYLFDINDQQWQRIKLNLDSKCRTAFRRKRKGMSLTVKGFREKSTVSSDNTPAEEHCNNQTISLPVALSGLNSQAQDVSEVTIAKNDENVDHVQLEIPSVIHTDRGDVHIIHATFEDLKQLKANHHIEILETAEFTQLTDG